MGRREDQAGIVSPDRATEGAGRGGILARHWLILLARQKWHAKARAKVHLEAVWASNAASEGHCTCEASGSTEFLGLKV